MTEIVLSVEQFRKDFDAFADNTKYSDAKLNTFISRAYKYCSNKVRFVLDDCERLLAIELMTAHLLTLKDMMDNGNPTLGQVGSSTIGSVSVSLVAPLNRNALQYWLNLTGYGKDYLALLASHAPMGFYAGGSFQRVFR